MDIESFEWGKWRQGNGYSYYLPKNINREWEWNHTDINILLEEASMKLGELNSFARLVPNIDLFIQLHVTTEAVVSSRIEGTQTNIDEAFLPEEEVNPERRQDWKEVRNYTNALNHATKALQNLPISSRLICQIHDILMSNVRGEHKLPGEYRKSQNWIGGATIEDAIFIPPDHPHIQGLMGDLEKFVHNEEINVPDLIRIGIIHYQFETVHPFLDGNGRLGRLLITLYLVSKNILDNPLLYLSKFFERHKSTYYNNLMRVREKNNMVHWLRYFLVGVRDTAVEAVDTLSSVLKLKDEIDSKIQKDWGRRTDSALLLSNYLFKQPVIRIKDAQKVCDLSARAASNLVKSFEDAGFLHEITGNTRNRKYLFSTYLKKFSM